jgi:hypothetical protein
VSLFDILKIVWVAMILTVVGLVGYVAFDAHREALSFREYDHNGHRR